MRPPIPRVGRQWRAALTDLVVPGAMGIGAVRADAATYPNPGVVTGAITGVHDPAMIDRPDRPHHNGTNSQPTNGRPGINLLGWDSAGRPSVY